MLPCTSAVELNYCGKVFSFLDPKESTNSGCAGKVASALLKKKKTTSIRLSVISKGYILTPVLKSCFISQSFKMRFSKCH